MRYVLVQKGLDFAEQSTCFFEPERIPKIRKMILSKTVEEREKALEELIPFQKGDFKALYEVMEGDLLRFVSWIRRCMSLFRQTKRISKHWQRI